MNNQISKYGIATGLLWAMSFYLTMRGTVSPVLGMLGNILAIIAPFIAGKMLVRYQLWMEEEDEIGRKNIQLSYLTRLALGFQIQLGAAAVCTFFQYIYFRFLDNGFLLSSLTTIFENPEYSQAMKQMLPEYSSKEILEIFSTIPLADLTFQFLMINLFIAIVFTPICAAIGKKPLKSKG